MAEMLLRPSNWSGLIRMSSEGSCGQSLRNSRKLACKHMQCHGTPVRSVSQETFKRTQTHLS